MSAAAVPIYKMLIAKGVSEEEARQVAEDAVTQAVDIRLSENLQAAKTHADQAVVKSEEKADAKFVSQARFHELDKHVATRGDIAELRAEMAQLRTELRQEIKFMNRIGIGLLAAMFMLVAQLVIGA